jgi:hypothetical protein
MHRSRVDAFRHRAAAIMSQYVAGSHVYPSLTLPLAPIVIASEAKQSRAAGEDWIASSATLLAMTVVRGRAQNACRATKVIRQGLWPMFRGARDVVNPAAVSLATISASLYRCNPMRVRNCR